MSITENNNFEQLPGEEILISCLQKNLSFTINNKQLKRGRLLLFRRFHYFIQLSLLSEKGVRENIEVPIPFNIEHHSTEGLIYFDYRLKSLQVATLPKLPDKIQSVYFDKILEIQVINNTELVCI